ncbi:MAG: hypothetical protein N4A40_03235 [Tissierellales bacterium]|jgi:uncharacterized protein YpmB|nr:hypothetical protein [Tissierellales bacterium]
MKSSNKILIFTIVIFSVFISSCSNNYDSSNKSLDFSTQKQKTVDKFREFSETYQQFYYFNSHFVYFYAPHLKSGTLSL